MTVGKNMASISDEAFMNCTSLKRVVIPKGVKSIGDSAFMGCTGLERVDISYSVKSIGASAFKYCSALTDLDLGGGVETIGDYAFYGCSSLRDVEFRSIAAPVLENAYNYNGNLLAQYNNDYATASAHPLWVSWYSDMYELAEDAPGYELLHGIFDMSGYQAYYYTFKALAGSFAPIQMLVPSNDNITGYDSIIYEAFFGKVTADSHSTFVAREQALVDFVDYARAV